MSNAIAELPIVFPSMDTAFVSDVKGKCSLQFSLANWFKQSLTLRKRLPSITKRKESKHGCKTTVVFHHVTERLSLCPFQVSSTECHSKSDESCWYVLQPTWTSLDRWRPLHRRVHLKTHQYSVIWGTIKGGELINDKSMDLTLLTLLRRIVQGKANFI